MPGAGRFPVNTGVVLRFHFPHHFVHHRSRPAPLAFRSRLPMGEVAVGHPMLHLPTEWSRMSKKSRHRRERLKATQDRPQTNRASRSVVDLLERGHNSNPAPLAAAAMHPRGYAAAARSLSLRRRTARLCSSSCWSAGCFAYCLGGCERNAASAAGFSLPSRDNGTIQLLLAGVTLHEA